MENINIKVDGENITFRTGKALELKDPIIILIVGTLITPFEWLQRKICDLLESHIIVNREKLTIELVVNAKSAYSDSIKGKLLIDPVFEKFAINSGKYLRPIEMSDLFKMNRNCFEDRTTAAQLVSELRNLKMNVSKVIEKAKDTKGNERNLFEQVVSSNIPEKFRLCMPIFKGLDKQSFDVEVVFNADEQTCSLQSVECNEIIQEFAASEINKVLNQVKEEFPDLAIFEV